MILRIGTHAVTTSRKSIHLWRLQENFSDEADSDGS
jgi:hypothetical protein